MILFLNKTDLFMEKIKRRGIDYLFKKYKGNHLFLNFICLQIIFIRTQHLQGVH